MTDPIWKKSGTSGPDTEVMSFLAGEDVVLDRELLLFDIQASAAHANGLEQIGILDAGENARMQEALNILAGEYRTGKRTLGTEFEDGHSAIEAWLIDMLGPLGAKIHAGRSRNDQVAVAMRLFLKDRLSQLAQVCKQISQVLLERAEAEKGLAIPGHTHLQKAMPSSAGLWLAGHAEAFIDNAEFALMVRDCIDASPLGTASGFGINLPLAREEVARELQFSRIVVNPQYAQNSRGKVEILALSALSAATLDLRRMAWDLSLFTTAEFGYINLADRYCTGSSIMPNKNNPDVVELLRATHAVVVGAQAELNDLLSLPSGYHRDLQSTKPPFMRAAQKALPALKLLADIVSDFEWNRDRLAQAITPEMFATDRATELAAQGVPFREAYRQVGESLSDVAAEDLETCLSARVSTGASGNLSLDLLHARLDKIQAGEN
jgi:argininosuccinate lyase